MLIFAALLLSLFITLTLVPLLRGVALRWHLVDLPGERKVHLQPIPRIGGVAMALGVLIPVLLWMPSTALLPPLMAACGLVVAFGFVDDVRELGAGAKLVAQIAAALIVIFWGGVQIRTLGSLLPEGLVLPSVVSIPLTLLVIVGVTNAFNLADGLDGLAGGISLLIFMGLTYLGLQSGHLEVALVAACVCGAIFGFLRFNTHPASIFMGDAGSQLLGFLAIVLSLVVSQQPPYSPMLPLLLLGLPVFDTLRVMGARLAQGQSPFRADRNHMHHKLLGMGFYHAEAVAVIYLIQAPLTLVACLLRFHGDGVLLSSFLGFSGSALVLLQVAVVGEKPFPWRRYLEQPLRSLRSRILSTSLPIRCAFAGLKGILLLLGLLLVAAPHGAPAWLGWFVFAMGGVTLAGLLLPAAINDWLLRCGVYLTVPFLVYFSHLQNAAGLSAAVLRVANYGYLLLGLTVLLVVKLTRRSGYRSTPLDLLILLIILIVPLWAGLTAERTVLLVVAAKIVALFFSFEVLVVELRRALHGPQLVTGLLLLLGGVQLVLPSVF
jgi:UDP-GlcNAc:undecaprenyl-phosphate GlcNAc-1-phosphate transferase